MVSSPAPPTTGSNRATEFAECGWRTVIETQDDSTTEFIHIPLTPEEFLHPQEGFRLPNSTFHDDAAGYAKDVLTRRYANDSSVGVFRDLLIEWDSEGQGNLCPDTCVAFDER